MFFIFGCTQTLTKNVKKKKRQFKIFKKHLVHSSYSMFFYIKLMLKKNKQFCIGNKAEEIIPGIVFLSIHIGQLFWYPL